MAVKIPNLIQRNGIYYFRCRIPSNLTDGQYREVKVSLKTRTFDSLLFESIRRTSDYLQQIVFDVSRKHRIDNANYVFEIRNQISQYIKNILIEPEFYEKVHREHVNRNDFFQNSNTTSQIVNLRHVEKIDTLGDLVKAYLAIPHGNDAKYNADIVNTLNLLCEWFGKKTDIRRLSRREMRDYRDNVLRKLPINRKKSPKLRNKTLIEHLADTEHKKISIPSINYHLARLSGFFSWCVDGEYISSNPVSNMSIEKTSKASEEREVYSNEELKKIITLLLPANLHAWAPYKFWIPLIMLYCGCRQNEVCQLYISDIVEVDNVLCFRFTENEETGARIKNSSSIRTTPIHPILLQLGLLEYVVKRIKHSGISDAQKIQLWSECTYDKVNGYARVFRRFFERFNRKYITQNPKKTCYSLRHNFIDNLKQREVPENIVSEIAGHSNGNITYRRYGKTLKASIKRDAMIKLDFGFNVFEVVGLPPQSEVEISKAASIIKQKNINSS